MREFQFDVYSQHGEDGVIAEVLRRLGQGAELDRWCCEFGAWDGVHLSNTCRLIREQDYSAVLIESDGRRVNQISENFPGDKVIALERRVDFGEARLDLILGETPIPTAFDLLSIDIDGADYHVLASIAQYKPKLIVCEFNATIPNNVDFTQEANMEISVGSSLLAISRLGSSKGYTTVAATNNNAFLVDNQYVDLVQSRSFTLDELRPEGRFGVQVFAGYDGTVFSSRPLTLPWHRVRVNHSELQVVPLPIRKFPSRMTKSKRFALHSWRKWRRIRLKLRELALSFPNWIRHGRGN